MIKQQQILLYTLFLIGTFCAANLLLAQPQPLPQRQINPNAQTLTYSLLQTTPAKLGQVLRQVCPHRFTAESSSQYTFTVQRNNVPRQSALRIDPQANSVSLTGDKQLCDQIFQLLNAIDQPLPPGKGRQIVPYQHVIPEVIAQALELYRIRTPQQPQNEFTPIRQVNHQFEGNVFGGAQFGEGIPSTQFGDIVPGAQPGDPATLNAVDDFQYRFFPELDSMVIQADDGARLKQFVDMIRQLEELSKQQRPKIEIIHLKHVNNVSLGAIFYQQNAAVYSDVFRTVPGAVRILPMTTPNAIMLLGWGDAMDTARELVSALDRPIAAEHSGLHLFKLKHISASQVQQVILRTFPAPPPATAYATSGFMPRIQVFAEQRSNTLIIQAAPNDLEEVKRIIAEIDVVKAAPTLQVKPIKLKHTLAPDLAATLKSAIAANTTDGKSPALELRLQSPEGQKLIQSGIMTDVVVESDTRNNVIIVRAPEACMLFIEELVNLLDTASPEAEVKIFQIENGDAESLSEMLTKLIPSNIAGTPGPQLPGAVNEETMIQMTFAVDRRTNSLIVAGSKGDLHIVEALINSLDREDQLARQESVYFLKNMKAADVSATIMSYINNRLQVQNNSPGVISPYQQIESAVIVVPDEGSNSLIISATPKYYEEILKLIKEIDKSPPQVVIRVLIAEVTLSNNKEWAAELGFQDPLLYLRGKVTPGLNFNDPTLPLGNDEVKTGTVGTQILTNFGVRKENGGVFFSASSDYLNVMLQALHSKNRLEVLSSPQVTTMNNKEALVSVGQSVPRFRGTIVNQGVSQPDIEDVPVELRLMVTPTISPDGTIVMAVGLTKAKLGATVRVGTADIETIDNAMLTTMVSAANDQTVVLGGLITKDVSTNCIKVPLLGDIPFLGKLFRHETSGMERKELLVILTPRIVQNREDMDRVKQMEMARMSWCLNNVVEVYGDVGAYSVVSDTPYTGDVPIEMPEAVKMEELQPMLAPSIPAPTLPKKE